MKNYKIKKLDRRMNGFGKANFTHCITPTWANTFHEYRIWLWETYGPSIELADWAGIENQSEEWAWHTEYGYRRLYLSNHALTHFILAHSA